MNTKDTLALKAVDELLEKNAASLKERTPSTQNTMENIMTGAVDEHEIERQCKMTWDNDAGTRAEFQNNFASFLAYTKAEAAGRVRIAGRKSVGGRERNV
jgi:hypothetical protein